MTATFIGLDADTFCTATNCHQPATYRQLTGMLEGLPVYQLVCANHTDEEKT